MYKYETLENGLVVASDNLTHTQTVAINLLVKLGSRYETEELNGISHFLEHMSFKGTATRNAKLIAEEFELLGAHFNAYTSREHTVYTVFILKDHVEKALDILSDIIQNSSFAEEEVERERTVILQEIAQCLDSPDDVVFDNLQAKVFQNQSIGRTIIGTADIINKISSDDLRHYVKNYYNASCMVLSIAGGIDHNEVMRLAKKYFANMKKGDLIKTQTPHYVGGHHYQEKDLEQVQILMCFSGISLRCKDYYIAQLFSAILGEGMSSRLFQEVREKRGLVYSVGSYNLTYSDVGTFNLYAGTDTHKVNEVIEVMATELINMNNGITDIELKRVKERIKTSLMASKEMSSHRAAELASDYSIYGRHIDAEETLREIDQVSKTDIAEFAKKLYQGSVVSISAIGKLKGIMDYDKVKSLFTT